ncbi:V-type ATP synthase subunit C [Deinococcus irradiatisoli]|uniref:V-type ATP synthase subunit C n=1 Tax=Deinococcus irradiatisoli TaxID=2202254 RepID=A0A2Z3JGH9_9DEIO|nr:V-type ATPase subunit [Deinococcus irradiatisoli]AWN22450.1 V-type ATP synthase subunit C [Deinococcus irradiatisoli]
MADDYGYINARIKMMRTQLLDGRALEAAMGAQTYPEFLRLLSESELSGDLSAATAQGAGLPELDQGLSKNFFENVEKVYRLADGDAKTEIGVLLQKWDLVNLKSIARGLTSGRSGEDLLGSLIPGGTIPMTTLQTAVQAGDLAAAATAITLTGHPLAAAFREGVGAYNASGKLLDLEIALDQAYYRYALRVSRNTSLRRYLSREVDITNALTSRSLRGSGANPALFVEGGRSIDAATFARLTDGDPSGAGDVAAVLEAATPAEAERVARGLLDEAARNAAAGDPLGVGVAIDYLRRKEQEIAKLRLIGRGKFYNVPDEDIRQEVAQA